MGTFCCEVPLRSLYNKIAPPTIAAPPMNASHAESFAILVYYYDLIRYMVYRLTILSSYLKRWKHMPARNFQNNMIYSIYPFVLRAWAIIPFEFKTTTSPSLHSFHSLIPNHPLEYYRVKRFFITILCDLKFTFIVWIFRLMLHFDNVWWKKFSKPLS